VNANRIAHVRPGTGLRSSAHAKEPKHIGTVRVAAFRREVKSMLTLFPLTTLMADAARVIEIRLRMMAFGTSTPAEIFLIVSEKMDAIEEAKAIIARGGNPSLVIENYQRIVAANVARLSAKR
jgi:hypothetical protein